LKFYVFIFKLIIASLESPEVTEFLDSSEVNLGILGDEKCIKILVDKPEEKKPFGRHIKWGVNTKVVV
jgi:hypothetical protein